MNKQNEDAFDAWFRNVIVEVEASRLDYFKSPLDMYKFYTLELTGKVQARLLGFRVPRTREEVKAKALEAMAVLDAAAAHDSAAAAAKGELLIAYHNATLDMFGHGEELEGYEGAGYADFYADADDEEEAEE